MKLKKFIIVSLLLVGLCAIVVILSDTIIADNSEGKLYSNVADVLHNKVGLLLGTSNFLLSGAHNPFYDNRIDAAIKLINAGDIRYVIVSGDNGRKREVSTCESVFLISGLGKSQDSSDPKLKYHSKVK